MLGRRLASTSLYTDPGCLLPPDSTRPADAPECISLCSRAEREWCSRHHGRNLRHYRRERDRRIASLIGSCIRRKRREDTTELLVFCSIAELWSRRKPLDEHHRVMSFRKDHEAGLNV